MPEHDPQDLEKAVKAAQTQILDNVKASQEWILESVRNVTAAAQQSAQQTGTPVTPPIPVADLKKMVDDAFDFTEKLLASQRDFTHKLVAASAEPENGSSSAKD